MSNDQTLILHTVMILALAALIFMVSRQLRGEITMLRDRLDTQHMNGFIANPVPVPVEGSETHE